MPAVGRGGAGNIQSVSEANERVSKDLEANQAAAELELQYTSLRPSQHNAYVGRGGVGNYEASKEMANSSHDKASEVEETIGDGVNTLGSGHVTGSRPIKAPASGQGVSHGRGGAGNYAFDSSESGERAVRTKMEEEEQKRQRLEADVERGVKDTLAMPPKAKLAGAEPY